MKEEKNGGFVLPLDSFPSRNSSMGRSSRLYYRMTSEGVPFQWEMQPGTPKSNPPLAEAVPQPICPPPVVLSLRLLKPPRVQNKPPLFVLFGPRRKQSKSKNNSWIIVSLMTIVRNLGPVGPSVSYGIFSVEIVYAGGGNSRPLAVGMRPWRINPIKIAIRRRV